MVRTCFRTGGSYRIVAHKTHFLLDIWSSSVSKGSQVMLQI
jgi:hypothetical protein